MDDCHFGYKQKFLKSKTLSKTTKDFNNSPNINQAMEKHLEMSTKQIFK
jgi:hypothetical protein